MMSVRVEPYPSLQATSADEGCSCERIVADCVYYVRIAASVASIAASVLFGAAFATTGVIAPLVIAGVCIVAAVVFYPRSRIGVLPQYQSFIPLSGLPSFRGSRANSMDGSFFPQRSAYVPPLGGYGPLAGSQDRFSQGQVRATVGSHRPEVDVVSSGAQRVFQNPGLTSLNVSQGQVRATVGSHRPEVGVVSSGAQRVFSIMDGAHSDDQGQERVQVGSHTPQVRVERPSTFGMPVGGMERSFSSMPSFQQRVAVGSHAPAIDRRSSDPVAPQGQERVQVGSREPAVRFGPPAGSPTDRVAIKRP